MHSSTINLESLFKSCDPTLVNNSVEVPARQKLVVTTDTLIEGMHFPLKTPAHAVGYKSLAANVSDLAAMGAIPHACSIVLGLPEYNKQWMQDFVRGWIELAKQYSLPVCDIDFIQNSTQIEIHVSAFGLLSKGEGLYRHQAQPGDYVFVSGAIGEAAAGLALEIQANKEGVSLDSFGSEQAAALNKCNHLLTSRLRYPIPRIELGRALNGIATACLDISDGLLADLGHISHASKVSACINSNDIYLSDSLVQYCSTSSKVTALDYALTGGDDYELCFTVPPERVAKIKAVSERCKVRLTHIGEIAGDNTDINSANVTVVDSSGRLYKTQCKSYEHFNKGDSD